MSQSSNQEFRLSFIFNQSNSKSANKNFEKIPYEARPLYTQPKELKKRDRKNDSW